MKVLTKYEVLETRELNEVEIYGIEAMINQYIDDLYEAQGTFKTDLYYCEGMLHPECDLHCDQGKISRIGMVCNRVVVEINPLKLQQDDQGDWEEIATDETIIYWFDPRAGGFELYQIEG